MVYDRYYYSLLSDGEKAIYKDIYHGIENHAQQIAVKRSLLFGKSFETILEFIDVDNPHLFYVDFTEINWNEHR